MFGYALQEWKILQLANYSNISKKLAKAINGGGLLNNPINITVAGGSGGTGYTNSWAHPSPGGASGQISIQDLSTDWGSDPYVKKYQVLEIEEDLLALSCAWQRIREERKKNPSGPYITIAKLTDPTLFKSVTSTDHDKAAQVRDYYSKKIMLWKLKGEHLTKFREDMNTFIHTDGKIFKEDMMPLAYRLPEFYDYDLDFDLLSNEYNKKVVQDQQNFAGSKKLKLVKSYIVGKKYNKRKEYWFSDDNNDLVSLSVVLDNPLLSLLDLYTQDTIKVDAIYSKKSRDNNEYLIANKFKFA